MLVRWKMIHWKVYVKATVIWSLISVVICFIAFYAGIEPQIVIALAAGSPVLSALFVARFLDYDQIKLRKDTREIKDDMKSLLAALNNDEKINETYHALYSIFKDTYSKALERNPTNSVIVLFNEPFRDELEKAQLNSDHLTRWSRIVYLGDGQDEQEVVRSLEAQGLQDIAIVDAHKETVKYVSPSLLDKKRHLNDFLISLTEIHNVNDFFASILKGRFSIDHFIGGLSVYELIKKVYSVEQYGVYKEVYVWMFLEEHNKTIETLGEISQDNIENTIRKQNDDNSAQPDLTAIAGLLHERFDQIAKLKAIINNQVEEYEKRGAGT
jgi:hypothetical protein